MSRRIHYANPATPENLSADAAVADRRAPALILPDEPLDAVMLFLHLGLRGHRRRRRSRRRSRKAKPGVAGRDADRGRRCGLEGFGAEAD